MFLRRSPLILESTFGSPPPDRRSDVQNKVFRVNQMQSEYKTENSVPPQSSKKWGKNSLDGVDSGIDHGIDQSSRTPSNQLVLYNSTTSGPGQDVDLTEDHISFLKRFLQPNLPHRVLPSIGAFTIQCASCFKWRLIPTKEKYEEIRENILQEPFVCRRAREWRPDILCDDPEDISPDGNRLWAIDKPNIAQPPPGWERLLRIRGEGSTRFADVYYSTPSGKRLRSMVEIERYLQEHPEHIQPGVNLSQFSFQIPRPLQENYVKKRRAHWKNSCDDDDLTMSNPLEPKEVKPLSWEALPNQEDLQIDETDGLAPAGEVAPVQSPHELSKSTARKKIKIRRPMPDQSAS